MVAMDGKEAAAGKAPSYPPLVDDIRSALCGTSDFPEGAALLPYGGSEPARFERVPVVAPDGDGDAAPDKAPPASFLVPRLRDAAPARGPWAGGGRDAFSYSSLAAATWRAAALPEQDAADGSFSLEPPAALADEGRAPRARSPRSPRRRRPGDGFGQRVSPRRPVRRGDGDGPRRRAPGRLRVLPRAHGRAKGPPGRRVRTLVCKRRVGRGALLARPARRDAVCRACGLAAHGGRDGPRVHGRGGTQRSSVQGACGGLQDRRWRTGSPSRRFRERHLLQAQCYACALLSRASRRLSCCSRASSARRPPAAGRTRCATASPRAIWRPSRGPSCQSEGDLDGPVACRRRRRGARNLARGPRRVLFGGK